MDPDFDAWLTTLEMTEDELDAMAAFYHGDE